MEISTRQLKKELSSRYQELEGRLTDRLWWVFQEVLAKDFFKDNEEKIHVFDLIVRVITRTDKTPAENIANLMVLISPDNDDLLDKRSLSCSAGFIRDYLKKDQINSILEAKKEKKGIWDES